jgi:hypothetical protein
MLIDSERAKMELIEKTNWFFVEFENDGRRKLLIQNYLLNSNGEKV